jgi:hypothetical protein
MVLIFEGAGSSANYRGIFSEELDNYREAENTDIEFQMSTSILDIYWLNSTTIHNSPTVFCTKCCV